MRQRKIVIGLLVLAALSLGLMPVSSTAGPETAWACAAVYTTVQNECTVTGPTGATPGGALYHGAVRIYVNNVLKFQQGNPDCYHLSTLPVPPGAGCPEAKELGGAGKLVRAVADSPGAIVIVGSRGA
jgi:hypothetical protein